MDTYKKEFIDFMERSGVVTFGDFTTKSGRKTPFFINTGNYDTGAQIDRLGHFYAQALASALGEGFDNLYGPAYKGIPLCVSASGALAREMGRHVTFTFNRKEVKDHGEGGGLIGHRYGGGERIVIVEDVITAGTSVRESVEILRAQALDAGGVRLCAVIVSVDRMERGQGSASALDEISREFHIPVFAIVTIDEVVEHLRERIAPEILTRVAEYRARYGAVKE